MSGHHGVSRFLSISKRDRGDKHHLGRHHERDKATSENVRPAIEPTTTSNAELYGLFSDSGKPVQSQEEQAVKMLRRRMMEKKSVIMRESQILYALRSDFSHGDPDRAFDLLLAISDSSEGLITDYDPHVKLLGSANREGVTCFLDSTLFAMFSRLDSFEAMLYNTFDDTTRSRLALLLRLWVNLLRSGQFITTDITKLIQESLAECGWEDAAELQQQDASEAFTFITGKLELPLLTLKMDIYHTGREDVKDDHKFINERLLEVAIPADPPGDSQTITLEDCLENYFNNRVEVRRYLERRSTLSSVRSHDSTLKPGAVHVETVEVDPDSSPVTPLSSSPSTPSITRPSTKQRSPSIIQQRFIPDLEAVGEKSISDTGSRPPTGRIRTGSIRKEVLMPAWQFFSLIPWYTDNPPTNDTQVAAHFSTKRPVLGMCLKRYSMTATGRAMRLSTKIDIPVEIGLPHFIQDDHMDEEGPLYGNFKLSLQSVVCHRGNSVNSGHYISLVRGTNMAVDNATSATSALDTKHWMRFDDLASRRITLVDIEQALKEETPYLLFYQIVPIDGDPGRITEGEQAPFYAGSETQDSGIGGLSRTSLSLTSTRDEIPSSGRPSFEITAYEGPRGRPGELETRRQSVTFDQTIKEPEEPSLPVQKSSQPMSRPASHHRSNSSHTRRASQASDMLSKSLSMLSLTAKRSKEALTPDTAGPAVLVQQTPRSVMDPTQAPAATRKDGKREKSRSRLGKTAGASGKSKHQKPDRECSVM